MEHTGQLNNSAEQAHYYGDIYELRLYVIGNNNKSQLAFENLKKICSKYLGGRCHIEVIDLTKNPNLARADQIIAVPTLTSKKYPGRRIIGDLSNTEKVLDILVLHSSNKPYKAL
jgi:circadian clock protein KaiB